MNNFQLKTAERCLRLHKERRIKLDAVEIGFLEESIAEHKMTDGYYKLSRRQNKWLNQIGSKER